MEGSRRMSKYIEKLAKTPQITTPKHRQQLVIARGKGVENVGKGKGRIHGDGRSLDIGW